MVQTPLDYALPGRHRLRWRLAVLVFATVAAATAGKLCWDKFGEPLRYRLATARYVESSAKRDWEGVAYMPNPKSEAAQVDAVARHMAKMRQDLEGSRLAMHLGNFATNGSTLYFGYAGEDKNRRYLFLTVTRTDTSLVASLTLVARVYSVATLMSPPRQIGDAQIFPFLTFREGFSVDPVAKSETNPRLFVLTGQRDDAAFRFELTVDGTDRVQWVEDSPASQPNAK